MKAYYSFPEIEILALNAENDVIRTSDITLWEIGDGEGDDWE